MTINTKYSYTLFWDIPQSKNIFSTCYQPSLNPSFKVQSRLVREGTPMTFCMIETRRGLAHHIIWCPRLDRYNQSSIKCLLYGYSECHSLPLHVFEKKRALAFERAKLWSSPRLNYVLKPSSFFFVQHFWFTIKLNRRWKITRYPMSS